MKFEEALKMIEKNDCCEYITELIFCRESTINRSVVIIIRMTAYKHTFN